MHVQNKQNTNQQDPPQAQQTLRQKRGQDAELAVAGIMERKGYRILARNYRVHRIGEIDLIAGRGDRLIFIEVKARRDTVRWGGPEAAIGSAKLKKIQRTAVCYLKEKHKMNHNIYFLAALVKLDRFGKPEKISFRPIECL